MDVRETLVITANLGSFERPVPHIKQSVPHDIRVLTDKDFPPRFNSMTPRLQARIPKMTAWQMFPGYEYYIWVDSSCRFPHEDSIKWFIEQLGDKDLAVFKHPNRKTVQEEADYLFERIELEKAGKKQKYILPRYENERLHEQMAVVDGSAQLFASTAFIYKNDTPAHDALTIWWLHTSLYHSIDQLSLPTALAHSGATYNVIDENYMKCDYLEYTRKK